MSLLLRRSPTANLLTPESQEKMKRVENCIHCNHCVNHCPYSLNTPELLRRNYEDVKARAQLRLDAERRAKEEREAAQAAQGRQHNDHAKDIAHASALRKVWDGSCPEAGSAC